MSRTSSPTPASGVRGWLRQGSEPAPAAFVVRLSCYPWLVIATTCIGAFIGQLDASIVQLTLPTLESEFAATLTSVSWVSIAYLIAMASILPVFGRIAEIFGRKLLYLVGYALFGVASLLCGFASDLPMLIAFRVLQGIGGALLGANSIAILAKAAGEGRHGRAMGVFAAAQAIGVSAGPAVGGLLLGTLGWQWVFWASVPFALAGAAVAWAIVPQTVVDGSDKHFDWRGALLLTPALTCLVLVLSEFENWGPTSVALIAAVIVAVALLALVVWQERSTAAPLVDPRLFGYPAFCGGIVAVLLSYALLYGMFFLMSFALVRGYGEASLTAGLRLAIIPIALGVVAPFSGALSERLGSRALAVAGMAMCMAALILQSAIMAESGRLAFIMAALALFGCGLGLFIAPNNDATMRAAPPDRAGEAGAMINLMRILGTSVGVAAASSMLSWRLEGLAGSGGHTLVASASDLLEAVRQSLPLLIAFAVVAGAVSLLRSHRVPPR
jgi:EmrB/QacA subfamily drug resistance transporter